MKKLLLATIITSILFSSCGGFLGVKITDQKAVDAHLRKKIADVIGADTYVALMDFRPSGHFSETMEMATVYYFPDEGDEMKSLIIYLAGKTEPREGTLLYFHERMTREDAVRLSDVDFSNIAANIAMAAELLEEEGYEFSGVSEYEITLSGNPSEIVHEFSIESKEGSKMTTKSGRLATETSYYEFTFKVDAEGNLEIKE